MIANPSGVNSDAILRGRLPPLNMLRAFEAVGRTGSMRRAADDIGASHTVVSRHVRNLESWIGQSLVESGPRGTNLTVAGRSLFLATTEAFKAVAKTAAQLKASTRAESLRICCMPGLATRWLAPRLSAIHSVLPGIDINLRALDYMATSVSLDVDLIIGFGDFDNLPTGATAIIRPRMFPVASPEWLEKNAAPTSIDQLTTAPLIHEESYEQWSAWLHAAGVIMRRPLSGVRLGDASMGFDAALASQGIALTTRLLVARDMDSGRLKELFDTDIRLGGYYLIERGDAEGKDYVKCFRDWLIENIRADNA